MGFFTLENGTEMSILEMVCAKKVAYLNSEDEGIIHDFSQKIIEEAAEVAAYDRLFSENISRKGRNRKTKNNGKRNADKAKRLHKADRYHGKGLESYLYKEDGVIKESIEQVWHRCHMPVLDRVRNKSALKAEAREQDYLSSIMDQEVNTTEIVEEENYDDFLWYLIDELPEQKCIILHSWYNGGAWENSEGYSDRFLGVKTKDEIIKELMERALHNDTEIQVNETEKKGLKGLCFNWDFGCDEWGDWNGFENFVLIPISDLN